MPALFERGVHQSQMTGGGGRLGAYHANVPVHGRYSIVRAGLEEFAAEELLDCEDDTIFASDAHCRASILYRLYGILDLEVPAVWREDGIGQIVAGAY